VEWWLVISPSFFPLSHARRRLLCGQRILILKHPLLQVNLLVINGRVVSLKLIQENILFLVDFISERPVELRAQLVAEFIIIGGGNLLTHL